MFDRRQFLKTSALFGCVIVLNCLPALGSAQESQLSKKSLEFLKSMLLSPSPSGYEQPAQKRWCEYTRKIADVRIDSHGNAVGVVNPKGSPRLMFAGHCDELGFMVRFIDEEGFIYFGPIGGFDESIIPGRRVNIYTANGPVPGVIGKTPIHLMDADKRKNPSQIKDLCIDIGAKDKEETESLIAIGDPITYTYDFIELRNGLVVARAFDDRIGSFIVAEILRELAGSKIVKASVHGVSTVQEEIGLRGATTSAFGVDPQVGIAIDVIYSTDHPGVDKKQVGDIRLGKGPMIARGPNINPRVFDLLVKTAKNNNIPYQVVGFPRGTPTDANAIQLTRAGVATGLVCIPTRYIHTPVETLDLKDVAYTIELLTSFAEALTPAMDFTP